MKNCPICDAPMDCQEFYTDVGLGLNVGPTEESYKNCPKGHYSYQFIFGSIGLYMNVPGPKVDDHPEFSIGWSYDEKPEIAILRENAINSFIAYARSQNK